MCGKNKRNKFLFHRSAAQKWMNWDKKKKLGNRVLTFFVPTFVCSWSCFSVLFRGGLRTPLKIPSFCPWLRTGLQRVLYSFRLTKDTVWDRLTCSAPSPYLPYQSFWIINYLRPSVGWNTVKLCMSNLLLYSTRRILRPWVNKHPRARN